jgi:hypothetical protein
MAKMFSWHSIEYLTWTVLHFDVHATKVFQVSS